MGGAKGDLRPVHQGGVLKGLGTFMLLLYWLKRLFRGGVWRRPRIAGMLAEIETRLNRHEPAKAEAACDRLARFLGHYTVGQVSREARDYLAATYFDLGSSYRSLSKHGEAEWAYREALTIWQDLSSSRPADVRILTRLAGCKNHLGCLYQDTGSLSQAADFFREALTLRESLLAFAPEDGENVVYLGGVLCNLGNVAAEQEDAKAALVWYERSIEILNRSEPGCDCGCRDIYANMMVLTTERSSPGLSAQLFLRNALAGRGALLEKQGPGVRYRLVRCSERENGTVVSILVERLCASRGGVFAQDERLQELKVELLDAISFARGPVVLDLQAVKEMDADGAALLVHLRSDLGGAGGWPTLCGLSEELRAANPSVPWSEKFECYASVDAALAALDV